MIGENGSELSRGERQRISLQEHFLKMHLLFLWTKQLPLLMLIMNRLFRNQFQNSYKQNKTVLIIAHRMITVSGVNKIIVLKDGKVVESGSPEELKNSDGIYKHMSDIQLSSSQWKY